MVASSKIPEAVFGAVLERAATRLNSPVLMIAVEESAEGTFAAAIGCHGLTRAQVEGAARQLLRILSDDLSGCPECADCQDRSLRVAAALAALETRSPQGNA